MNSIKDVAQQLKSELIKYGFKIKVIAEFHDHLYIELNSHAYKFIKHVVNLFFHLHKINVDVVTTSCHTIIKVPIWYFEDKEFVRNHSEFPAKLRHQKLTTNLKFSTFHPCKVCGSTNRIAKHCQAQCYECYVANKALDEEYREFVKKEKKYLSATYSLSVDLDNVLQG